MINWPNKSHWVTFFWYQYRNFLGSVIYNLFKFSEKNAIKAFGGDTSEIIYIRLVFLFYYLWPVFYFHIAECIKTDKEFLRVCIYFYFIFVCVCYFKSQRRAVVGRPRVPDIASTVVASRQKMDRLSRANAIRAILDSFAPTVSLLLLLLLCLFWEKKIKFPLKKRKRGQWKITAQPYMNSSTNHSVSTVCLMFDSDRR